METNMQSDHRKAPCSICGNLLEGQSCALRAQEEEMIPKFGDLIKSSDAGCAFCSAIMNALLAYMPFDILEEHRVMITNRRKCEQDSTLEAELDTNCSRCCTRLAVEIYTTSGDVHEYCTAVPLGIHISPDSSSSECLTNIHRWLEQCLSQHSCPKNLHQQLPKRVISVGDHGSRLFLHEPSEGERGCWAALSYRWGEQAFLTTLSLIEDRKCGFDLEELPRTCRDAVMVARALKIPYLWIDAVCVLQGDETNWIWKDEVTQMCSIYENALVTIAAIDGKDSEAGLFKIDPRRQATPFNVSPLPNKTMTIFARKAPVDRRYGCMSRRRRIGDQNTGSLHTRGWTLQEIFLSTRILWFTKSELGFTCPTSRACQCQPHLTKLTKVKPTIYSRHINVHSMKLDDLSLYEWTRRWLRLVEDYTSRDLAKTTDRLPALYGLMEAIEKRAGGRFCAGLWDIFLPVQLLWVSTEKGERTDMGTEYAPSWSWASISGTIAPRASPLRTPVSVWKVTNCHFTDNNDKFPGCGTGSVTIQAYSHPVMISGNSLCLKNSVKTAIGEAGWIILDGRMNSHTLSMLPGKKLTVVVARRFVDNTCSLHYQEEHPNKSWYANLNFDGLLLEAVSGAVRTFRRVGYLYSYSITWEELEPLLKKKTVKLI